MAIDKKMNNFDQTFIINAIFTLSKNHEQDFERIADTLLNKAILKVGDKSYLLREIEFYYYDPDNHPDPFVHKASGQAQYCA